MKAVDLAQTEATLTEVLDLASKENIILRTTDGREFVLAEIDDFAREVALVRQNEELMRLLAERSQETKKHTLGQVKESLKLR
jgi:hypothetical protein